MSDAALARTRWRCRRGLLELDLLLQRFVDHHYADLSETERMAFDRLLAFPDAELLALLQGGGEPDNAELAGIVATVRRHAHPRA